MKKARVQENLESAISNAIKLHGHLGPFLVIGVRVGKLAERLLRKGAETNSGYLVNLKIPLIIPFSCTIDGIQSTTHCTIGNQKLTIENSQQQIYADFKLHDSSETLNISINLEVVRDLMKKMAEGKTNEELAEHIASMPENRLFTVNRQ